MNLIAHMSEFYENYNTLSVPKLNNRILLLVHKFTYHRSKLPIAFTTYFNDNQLFYEYNTRGKNTLPNWLPHTFWRINLPVCLLITYNQL